MPKKLFKSASNIEKSDHLDQHQANREKIHYPTANDIVNMRLKEELSNLSMENYFTKAIKEPPKQMIPPHMKEVKSDSQKIADIQNTYLPVEVLIQQILADAQILQPTLPQPQSLPSQEINSLDELAVEKKLRTDLKSLNLPAPIIESLINELDHQHRRILLKFFPSFKTQFVQRYGETPFDITIQGTEKKNQTTLEILRKSFIFLEFLTNFFKLNYIQITPTSLNLNLPSEFLSDRSIKSYKVEYLFRPFFGDKIHRIFYCFIKAFVLHRGNG